MYWTSSPDTDSYKAFYRYLIDLQPHPDNGDYALATGMSDSCSAGRDCYTYVSLSFLSSCHNLMTFNNKNNKLINKL